LTPLVLDHALPTWLIYLAPSVSGYGSSELKFYCYQINFSSFAHSIFFIV